MPYCSYRDLKSTYILSTYQERIIRIGPDGTTSFEFGGGHWDYDQNVIMEPAAEASGLTSNDTPSFAIFDKTARPTYGGIIASDGTHFMLPDRLGPLSTDWLFYITTAAQDGDWLLVTSNSTPGVLLLNQRTLQIGIARIPTQGQRRVHGTPVQNASPEQPPLWRRGGLVG